MNYKEFKEKYPDKKERRKMFFTWFKVRIKDLWWDFTNSSFVKHISFLWHWKNFFFCLKYPFWKARNVWSRKFSGYSFTWYDDIPVGWQIAFGKQLSKDIKKAGKVTRKRLGKNIKWKDMISFEQIKEKWGELCLYASASDEIRKVLDYYENLSQAYCICCGKPARYLTTGWVSFQCEDCFVKRLKEYEYTDEEIEEEKLKSRLSYYDVPTITRWDNKLLKCLKTSNKEEYEKTLNEYLLEKEKNEDYYVVNRGYDEESKTYNLELKQCIKIETDLKTEYGIDLNELWGLKD